MTRAEPLDYLRFGTKRGRWLRASRRGVAAIGSLGGGVRIWRLVVVLSVEYCSSPPALQHSTVLYTPDSTYCTGGAWDPGERAHPLTAAWLLLS